MSNHKRCRAIDQMLTAITTLGPGFQLAFNQLVAVQSGDILTISRPSLLTAATYRISFMVVGCERSTVMRQCTVVLDSVSMLPSAGGAPDLLVSSVEEGNQLVASMLTAALEDAPC